MKIEVGKRYVRRDGTITPPLVLHKHGLIQDTGTDYLFRGDDGRVDSALRHEKDLINEYIEPTPVKIPTETLQETFAAATGISATLDARGTNYGDFHTQAAISQELSDAMVDTPKWSELSSGQREALQMIQHKIARILNGNPLYLDSWVDVVGYAELGKRETERLGGK